MSNGIAVRREPLSGEVHDRGFAFTARPVRPNGEAAVTSGEERLRNPTREAVRLEIIPGLELR